MKTPRVRLDMRLIMETDSDRAWRLTIDDADAGVLTATRHDSAVRVEFDAAAAALPVSARVSALGRVLGTAPFGHDVTYATGDAEAAAGTGFHSAAGGIPDAADTLWRREAPRPKPAADDITRYLDAAGRIDRYPARADARHALLAWVAAQAVSPGEALTESELGERLMPFAPAGDVAVLRRYLVDAALLERTPSGSQYRPVA